MNMTLSAAADVLNRNNGKVALAAPRGKQDFDKEFDIFAESLNPAAQATLIEALCQANRERKALPLDPRMELSANTQRQAKKKSRNVSGAQELERLLNVVQSTFARQLANILKLAIEHKNDTAIASIMSMSHPRTVTPYADELMQAACITDHPGVFNYLIPALLTKLGVDIQSQGKLSSQQCIAFVRNAFKSLLSLAVKHDSVRVATQMSNLVLAQQVDYDDTDDEGELNRGKMILDTAIDGAFIEAAQHGSLKCLAAFVKRVSNDAKSIAVSKAIEYKKEVVSIKIIQTIDDQETLEDILRGEKPGKIFDALTARIESL